MSQLSETNDKTPGALDPSFGKGGMVLVSENILACASLASNKLLTVSKAAASQPLTLVRLTEFGKPDASFGIGGVVEIPNVSGSFFPRQIFVSNNGRLLTSGPQFGVTPDNLYVMRMLEDGKLDSTFGATGRVTLKASVLFGTDIRYYSGSMLAVSEQDGKIYVSCKIVTSTSSVMTGGVIRLNENGSLDASFNGGCVTVEQPNGARVSTECFALHGDGVLLGGAILRSDGYLGDAFIIRYDRSGNVDTSFGNGGTLIIPNGADGRQSSINSIAVRSNGGIVASGESVEDGLYEGMLTVLNPNGSFNLVFNNGKPLSGSFLRNLQFSKCALQQEEWIIITGLSEGIFLIVARYDFQGSLDMTFGEGGWVVFRDAQTSGFVRSALTIDNKIVCLGSNNSIDFAVRYLG